MVIQLWIPWIPSFQLLTCVRAYVLDTDKESTKEKSLTHVLNTKNGIHGIQYINNLIKTKDIKNLWYPKSYPNGIQTISMYFFF